MTRLFSRPARRALLVALLALPIVVHLALHASAARADTFGDVHARSTAPAPVDP